jgi:hypothetical protein
MGGRDEAIGTYCEGCAYRPEFVRTFTERNEFKRQRLFVGQRIGDGFGEHDLEGCIVSLSCTPGARVAAKTAAPGKLMTKPASFRPYTSTKRAEMLALLFSK